MSLEAHHQFILNTMQRHDDIARKLIHELEVENARLKTEVEAHEKRWAESEDLISHYKQQGDEAYNDCQCHRLKAEVELLRKAGDAMCKFFDDHGFYGFGFQEAWNAAKEGKQP